MAHCKRPGILILFTKHTTALSCLRFPFYHSLPDQGCYWLAPAGAVVDDYYLGGYSSSLVKPPGKLAVISSAAAKSGNNTLQSVFQIRLNGTGASFTNTPTDFLMAVGPLDAAGVIHKHADAQVQSCY